MENYYDDSELAFCQAVECDDSASGEVINSLFNSLLDASAEAINRANFVADWLDASHEAA